MPTPEIQARLRSLGNSGAAAFAAGFFKTGPGQYGEGDVFLGIRVPVLRGVAKEYRGLVLDQIIELLRSAVHEERLLALLILVWRAAQAEDAAKKEIFDLYLAHTRFINNWDLVDSSAPTIVGGHLAERSRKPLDRLAASKSIWERPNQHHCNAIFHSSGTVSRYPANRRAPARRPGRPDSQGCGLDVARGRQAGSAGPRGVPAATCPHHAPDHAALCDRAVSGRAAVGHPKGRRLAVTLHGLAGDPCRVKTISVWPDPFSALNSRGLGRSGSAMQSERVPFSSPLSPEQSRHGLGLDQLTRLVEVVQNHGGRVDAEGVIDGGEQLARMNGI